MMLFCVCACDKVVRACLEIGEELVLQSIPDFRDEIVFYTRTRTLMITLGLFTHIGTLATQTRSRKKYNIVVFCLENKEGKFC
jgi:hypothetical protein